MGKKKETQGLLDQKTRLIGIAAAGHSVGCTHFSIMLLNYLAGYRRRRAALMEWNSTGDLERLEKVCTGMVRESSAYRVLEADYFKHAGPRELAMALGAGYDDILIDFGVLEEGDTAEFLRCEKRPDTASSLFPSAPFPWRTPGDFPAAIR